MNKGFFQFDWKNILTTIFVIFLLCLMIPLKGENPDTLKFKLRHSQGTEKLEILQSLTKYYLSKSADSCEKYGMMACDLAQQTNDLKNQALACKRIGYAHYVNGQYENSLNFYDKARKIYLDDKDHVGAAEMLNLFGDVYSQLGKFEEAISCLTQAEHACDTLIRNPLAKIAATKLFSIIYTNTGLLYFQLDSVQKPLKYFEKALQLATELKDSTRISASYNNLGMVYRRKKDFVNASVFYRKSLAISRACQDHRTEAKTLNNLANVFEKQNRIDSAMHYIRLAEKLYSSTGDKAGLAYARMNAGRYDALLGNFEKASQQMMWSLSTFQEIGDGTQIENCYNNLSNLYEKSGNQELALKYYKLHISLRDSIMGQETRKQVAEIQTRYETEKKEKENLALKSDLEVQQLKLSLNRTIIRSLIIGMVISVLLLAGIFYLYRKRNLAYKALVLQNLEMARCDKLIFEKEKSRVKDENPVELVSQVEENPESVLIKSFNDFMIEEKPYLYGNVSIEDVATRLSTNRTYLSNALNKIFQKSFRTIINEYRVKTARQLLTSKNHEHISVEGIGEMSGYNSRVVFYSNFKKYTGISPSYFREQLNKIPNPLESN